MIAKQFNNAQATYSDFYLKLLEPTKYRKSNIQVKRKHLAASSELSPSTYLYYCTVSISSLSFDFTLPQTKLIIHLVNLNAASPSCVLQHQVEHSVIMEITDLLLGLPGTISNKNVFSVVSTSVYHDEVWLAMSWKNREIITYMSRGWEKFTNVNIWLLNLMF